MINREHILQRHIRLFVRDAIVVRHEFLAFDRSQASGKFTHSRQAARGIRAGTPDCLLLIQGMPPIWCELKRPGARPTQAQEAMGQKLLEVGCFWTWVSSVEAYRLWLHACSVPLRQNAEFQAMQHDAEIASIIARAEKKRGKLPKQWKVTWQPQEEETLV